VKFATDFRGAETLEILVLVTLQDLSHAQSPHASSSIFDTFALRFHPSTAEGGRGKCDYESSGRGHLVQRHVAGFRFALAH